ncbi:MAG: prepilin peptidase [Candidatus Diapherotrites archaeon]|nr:prepilin peptidase [Candidatus Diapherotrites archaeon]
MIQLFYSLFFIQLIFFLISLTALIYASWTDLKERIVSNKLTYGLIFGGIILQGINSYLINSIEPIATALLCVIATFIASYALWKIGVWSGGDVKLFTGIAALNPVNYGILRDLIGLNNALLASIAIPLFPLTLFLFTLISVVPYGAMLAIKEVMKNKNLRKELIEEIKSLGLSLIKLGIIITGITPVLNYYYLPLWLILPILLLAGFQKKIMNSIIVILLFIAGIYFNGLNAVQSILIIAMPLFAIYFLLRFFLVSRKYLFTKEKKITELTEGEIIGETIILQENEVKRIPGIEIKRIINYLKNNKVKELLSELKPEGKIIASSMKAAGITEEGLKELKKLVEEKKIENKITVKSSAPLIPAVLLGYLIAQTTGDILWNLI